MALSFNEFDTRYTASVTFSNAKAATPGLPDCMSRLCGALVGLSPCHYRA
jgi:hypothetical protein